MLLEIIKIQMKAISRIILISIIHYLSTGIIAQSIIFQNQHFDSTQVELKFMKPFFDDAEGISFFTGIYELQVSTPISSNWNFVGNLPFGYTKIDFRGFSNSSSDIGNPFLGIQSDDLLIGVFLPLMSEDGNFIGAQTNLHDFHRYAPDVVTIYGNYQFMPATDSGIGYEVGPRIYIPTEGGGDIEAILHYGLKFISAGGSIGFSGEYNGWFFATEDFGDFTDRLNHMLSGGIFFNKNGFVPSLFVSTYLKEEQRDDIPLIVGLKLRVKM
jgi:hypothetical protein